jgi:hypothetical protein
MDKPSLITQWLTKPNTFTANDHEELNTIISRYPYFSPARYVDAANKHKHLPFEQGMMTTMQLFQGNWLLFYEHLDACEIIVQKQVVDNEAPSVEHIPLIPTTHFDNIPAEETSIIEPFVPVAPVPVEVIPVEVMAQGQPLEEVPFSVHPSNEEKETPTATLPPSEEIIVPQPETKKPAKEHKSTDDFLKPLYSEDYFLYQGIEIPEQPLPKKEEKKEDKSLMVMMSFSEWLMHFKTKNERDNQEKEDKKAIKSMWQKEKLAAALEEENEVIPENVFNMAVTSITKEEDLASESLAEVLQKQGKLDKAIDMYKKLSLLNPQKKAYFAAKIEQINKQIES